MINSTSIINRIDQLQGSNDAGELYIGSISLAAMLYGNTSPQVKAVEAAQTKTFAGGYPSASRTAVMSAKSELKGMLSSMRSEVEQGLIKSIRAEASGEVIAYFLILAKLAIEENQKDVAAVLACAALEDSLKSHARLNDLKVNDKDMSQVIGALKSAGLVKGAQGRLLGSFVTIRNKAFHAEWDKFETSDVKSVIGFVEGFLVENF